MVEFFREIAESTMETSLSNVSDSIILLMGIVLILILIVGVFALGVQIVLAIKYHKYNKKQNSIKMTGENIARKILDDNGLQNIKVKSSGSMLFGNSYSHYFKKVRLRRLTWKKDSVSSLAMASQKSCLAILDKENDPDMETRIKLTPFIYFGPLAFIPLIIIGLLLDILVFKSPNAIATVTCSVLGLLIYIISFIMSIKVLKTEKKAQEKAYELLKNNNMATDEELVMLKKLFELYNIQYVNDMIISMLELIYRILAIVASAQQNSSVSSD